VGPFPIKLPMALGFPFLFRRTPITSLKDLLTRPPLIGKKIWLEKIFNYGYIIYYE